MHRPDAGATDAAGGQDEGVGADAQRARRGLGVDGDDPPAGPLDVDHVEADLDPRARSQDPAAKGLEQPEAGHRGRQARDLEDAVAERPLDRRMHCGVVVEPKDCRQADPPRAGGERIGDRRQRRASARMCPRTAGPGPAARRCGADRAPAGPPRRARISDGPPGPCGVLEVAGRVRRPRVSEARESDQQQPVAGPRLEGGRLGGRQDRRRPQRPDRRRNAGQRVVERAAVRRGPRPPRGRGARPPTHRHRRRGCDTDGRWSAPGS